MQLRRLSAALAVACCGTWTAAGAATLLDEEPRAGSLLRLFSDSDRVSVRSWMGNGTFAAPGRAAFSLQVNHERVTIPAIDAPAGSQEAIDAITSASRPISGDAFDDYVKVRNEVQGAVSRGPATVEYYRSTESDYLAQQVGGSVQKDFLDEHLNLSIGTSYGWDAIEPLADDDTHTPADTRTTLHWNAVATRILGPATLLRVGVELNVVDGLQHNPYRNVTAGGARVPERHPDHRERRDAFVRVSQALHARSSLRLGYRLYHDDWGIVSHEVGTKLTQGVMPGLSARWEYRWYTQTAADFHRDEYASADGVGGYRSADYRMGELSSHLFGVALRLDLEALGGAGPLLERMGLWINVDRYFNSNNYSADILETGLDVRF